MADVFTKKKRSAIMAAIRSRGNRGTEELLAKMLRKFKVVGWRRGIALLGKPDFVFPRKRVALFVDGCFWHGCTSHCRMPTSNREYWARKIARNSARDKHITKLLKAYGWIVVRIWEHSLAQPNRTIRRINAALADRQQVRQNKVA